VIFRMTMFALGMDMKEIFQTNEIWREKVC
jgi:hypothetical protein